MERLNVPNVQSGGVWVKTQQGWKNVHNGPHVAPDGSSRNRRANTLRASHITNDKEMSNARAVIVNGCQLSLNQRKLTLCLSELIDRLDLTKSVGDQRREAYLHQLMEQLLTSHLHKVSGTAQRQLFKILEAMVNEAMSRELNIEKTKHILVVILEALEKGVGVGCTSLWKRHLNTVTNLQTKLKNFTYTERMDAGLTLTDLPKECIYDILFTLPRRQDILSLGSTCTDLYYMCQEVTLWESLCQYHFTEKQMLTFIQDVDELGEFSQWRQLYDKCYRKYGTKETFADQLVVCSGCRVLHWLMQGHNCWRRTDNYVDDKEPHMEPVSPGDLLCMLNLYTQGP